MKVMAGLSEGVVQRYEKRAAREREDMIVHKKADDVTFDRHASLRTRELMGTTCSGL